MCLKTGSWGPPMDLSVGKQVIATARIRGAPSLLKQTTQKTKEAASAQAKGKGKKKETTPFQAKRKVMEPQTEGVPTKKVMVSTMQASMGVMVRSFTYLLLPFVR